MMRGSTPTTAEDTMRVFGVRSKRAAASSEASRSAHAPSLMPEALPAVTVPPSRKAGRSFASTSGVVPGRMNSSASKTSGGAFRRGTSTGVISRAKRPRSRASAAFACDRAAKRS